VVRRYPGCISNGQLSKYIAKKDTGGGMEGLIFLAVGEKKPGEEKKGPS